MTPVSSPVTIVTKTPPTSPTSVSSSARYVATAVYSDSACKTLLYASVQILNSCYRSKFDASSYVYVTATYSTLRSVVYTDSLCTLRANETLLSFTDGACDGTKKIFITTSSLLSSNIATASLRYVNCYNAVTLYTHMKPHNRATLPECTLL